MTTSSAANTSAALSIEHQKIVAIGGGHGLGRVLAALSHLGEQATGIVTTTDNGGSTGRIRQCQGGIAWGDMRNCINQLITTPSIGSMLFEYRFRGNGELDGHNLGNLMLTALDNLSVRPLDAINLIRDMLNVDTHILPMSEHAADLSAIDAKGNLTRGEVCVDELDAVPRRLFVEPNVPATQEAVDAILAADLVLLGPGSFLTSVMPPLLLNGIGKALSQTKGQVVFITNLAQEPGPAGLMTLEEMLVWLERAMDGRPIDRVLTAYQKDADQISRPVTVTELASKNHEWRHDRELLKQAIERLLIAG
ncbi:Putative gluconeogenesis factor [Vibrio stylophorae]|uniref:Putative gluconeogenesis factor n=1 Tax=Vibrio stylophorae TaxID=659351 RepID=A0ABN8DSU8_9VIBR|nr:uridine diphosphate-N-acetylglucosamine-binding protein YvcK [Vibrio stylophorae]CAH0533314.1 Putative gluconeogenesis factor [Vibrio stylophorae]